VINYNYSNLLPITSTDNAYNCEYLVSGKLLPENAWNAWILKIDTLILYRNLSR